MTEIIQELGRIHMALISITAVMAFYVSFHIVSSFIESYRRG